MQKRFGFTLIELLIVVAIIAILAAIAVPNFLEAQTRSKVSRAKADMRTIATGIESYFVDYNHYPDIYPRISDPYFAPPTNTPLKLGLAYSRAALSKLSSPVSYLSTGLLTDPFAVTETATSFYGYAYCKEASQRVVDTGATSIVSATTGTGVVITDEKLGMFNSHIWVLQCVGPDRKNFALQGNGTGNFGLAFEALSTQGAIGGVPSTSFFYDPTNGTVSVGDVLRTAKINIP